MLVLVCMVLLLLLLLLLMLGLRLRLLRWLRCVRLRWVRLRLMSLLLLRRRRRWGWCSGVRCRFSFSATLRTTRGAFLEPQRSGFQQDLMPARARQRTRAKGSATRRFSPGSAVAPLCDHPIPLNLALVLGAAHLLTLLR